MNTPPEPLPMTRLPIRGYKLAQVLDELCDLTLEMDVNVEGADIRYTPTDAMNSLQIAMHVWQNIQIHNAQDSGESDPETFSERSLPVWKRLSDVFKEITGVDSRTFYDRHTPLSQSPLPPKEPSPPPND